MDTGLPRTNLLIRALGVIILLYFTLDIVREFSAVSSWSRSGFTQSSLLPLEREGAVFESVLTEDFTQPPYPAVGDTLLAVAGIPVTPVTFHRLFEVPAPAGKPLAIAYAHHGETQIATLCQAPPSPALQWHLVAVEILRFLTCLAFVAVGFWAVAKRGQSAVVRVFTLYGFAAGAMMLTHYQFIPSFYASLNFPGRPVIDHLLADLGLLLTALWLHLQLIFPRPLAFVRRFPALAYGLTYLPSLAAIVVHNSLHYGFELPFDAGPVIRLCVFAQILTSIAIPFYRYSTTANHLERRQLRLILWGSGTGLTINFIMVAASNYFPEWYFARMSRDLNFSTISFLALLLGPLSFAYAFGRYRLLDVEARLRRSSRQALITAVLLLALAGIVYIVGDLLLVRIGITSRTPTLAIAIALTLVMLPAQRRLHRVIERKLYPERQRLQEIMSSFLQQATSRTDKASFWSELEARLRDGLRVTRVLPVLKTSAGSFVEGGTQPTPFTVTSPLITEIMRRQQPLLIDEATASERVSMTAPELQWLGDRRIGLIVPLIARGNLIGFLAIGIKSAEEDYDAEELQLLDSLSSQIAVVTENMRLIEENVIKQHLEEQLQIARRIQLGFLPQKITPTPGLEIVTACRSCFEVAGDYHDVIPLKHDQTVLAIGDVSGKGVGAALLMANLQASLRSTVGTGISLDVVMQGINELIFHNTASDQFITFFVAVFDPRQSTLTYVNAGHNGPLLVRSDGIVEVLDVGGLILGCRRESSYQKAVVSIHRDDLLVMYTDGLSEAANVRDELFGDAHIQTHVQVHRRDSVNAILNSLEQEVVRHRGDHPLDDDLTVMIARAT